MQTKWKLFLISLDLYTDTTDSGFMFGILPFSSFLLFSVFRCLLCILWFLLFAVCKGNIYAPLPTPFCGPQSGNDDAPDDALMA